MSHILEFSIEGLAGRKDVFEATLDRHVNIFFGLNGSGKTSLLKILYSAMRGNSRILMNVPFRCAEVKVYSINYNQVFTYTINMDIDKPSRKTILESSTGEIVDSIEEYLDDASVVQRVFGSQRREIHDWQVEPDIRPENETGWAHRYLPTSRLYFGGRHIDKLLRSRPGSFSEDILDRHYAESLQTLWRNYYQDILTKISEAQEDGLASILKAVLSGEKQSDGTLREVDLETAYNRVSKFLERQGSSGILGSLDDFKNNYGDNPQLRSVVSDINVIEKRIAEVTAPRNMLQRLIQNMFSGHKNIYFRDRSIDIVTTDDEEIGLNTLSSGEKHILRILIETLLAEQNTILIDEPELSMHVDWQRELIKTMQQLNPSAQIIVATHSPEIMADLNDDRIFSL